MSALGQKQTFCDAEAMSALPPKADMCSATRHVRFVPIADMNITSRKAAPRGGLPNNVAYNGRAITSRRHFPCIFPYRQHAHHFCSSRNLPCLFFWHQQVL